MIEQFPQELSDKYQEMGEMDLNDIMKNYVCICKADLINSSTPGDSLKILKGLRYKTLYIQNRLS